MARPPRPAELEEAEANTQRRGGARVEVRFRSFHRRRQTARMVAQLRARKSSLQFFLFCIIMYICFNSVHILSCFHLSGRFVHGKRKGKELKWKI
jgi:hypothetical protein